MTINRKSSFQKQRKISFNFMIHFICEAYMGDMYGKNKRKQFFFAIFFIVLYWLLKLLISG